MADTEQKGTARGRGKLPPPKLWRKGQSGNPSGSSRKQRQSCAIKQAVADGKQDPAAIAQWLYECCAEGNVQAIVHWLDRFQGKVPDRIELDAKPIRVVWPHQLAQEQREGEDAGD